MGDYEPSPIRTITASAVDEARGEMSSRIDVDRISRVPPIWMVIRAAN